MYSPQPTVWLFGGSSRPQWAKTVFLWTFRHNLGKKSDTDVVDGLLEAYNEDKHEKMTKSKIWVKMGEWGQK